MSFRVGDRFKLPSNKVKDIHIHPQFFNCIFKVVQINNQLVTFHAKKKNEVATETLSITVNADIAKLIFTKIDDNWCTWREIKSNEGIVYQYRTNRKRIEVKCNGITASASCHSDDKFMLSKGLHLAILRHKAKVAKLAAESYAKAL